MSQWHDRATKLRGIVRKRRALERYRIDYGSRGLEYGAAKPGRGVQRAFEIVRNMCRDSSGSLDVADIEKALPQYERRVYSFWKTRSQILRGERDVNF